MEKNFSKKSRKPTTGDTKIREEKTALTNVTEYPQRYF